MYYGDDQSAYTHMRAAFGPYGGAIATNVYGAPQGYAPPAGYDPGGEGGPMGMVRAVGGAIRPVGYMPPPRVISTPSGQFYMESGLLRSLGRAIGYADAPRSMYAYEHRMFGTADFAERAGVGVAGAGLMAGAIAASPVLGIAGKAVGGFLGAGAGGLAGGLAGPAAALGLGKVGAAVGGFAGMMALPLAAAAVASDVTDHMAQQRQIRNYLEMSSFRFVGPGSQMADPIMGTGMSMRARRQVAEHMTEIDVADPFVDMKDLGRILRTSTELGLMNNTQDIDDFKRRFKSITDNVKLVTKALNTTIEEGLATMRDLRGIGVSDPGRATQLIMGSEVSGRVAGRTTQEMVSLGLQGAEMFRGTGVSMNIGFQAAQMNIAAVRAARDAGVLSQEAVAQAGGEEALAQRMTVSGLAFQQSALGRGTMAAMYGGRGANLDYGAIGQMLGGGMSMEGLALRGAQRLGSPRALIEYQANQPKMLSRFGEMYGGQANQLMQMSTAMTEAEYLQRSIPGLNKESALRFSLQGMGMTEPEIDTNIAMIRNAQKNFDANMASAEATRVRGITEQSVSNIVFTRWYDKFIKDPWTSVKQAITSPVNEAIDDFSVSLQKFGRSIVGIETADLTTVDYKSGMASAALQYSLGQRGLKMVEGEVATIAEEDRFVRGGPNDTLVARKVAEKRTGVGAMVQTARGMAQRTPINLDEGLSLIAKTGETMSDFLREGGTLESFVRGRGMQGLTTRREGTAPLDITLNVSAFAGREEGLSFEDFERLRKETRAFSQTTEEAERIATEGSKEFTAAVAGIEERMVFSGNRATLERAYREKNPVLLMTALTGKSPDKLTAIDMAASRQYLKGDVVGNNILDETRKAALTVQEAGREIDVRAMQQVQQQAEATRKKAAEALIPEETLAQIRKETRTTSRGFLVSAGYEQRVQQEARKYQGAIAGVVERLGEITAIEGRDLTPAERAELERRIISQSEDKIGRPEAARMIDTLTKNKNLMREAGERARDTQFLQIERGREAAKERYLALPQGRLTAAEAEKYQGIIEGVVADPARLVSMGEKEIALLEKAGATQLVQRKRFFEGLQDIVGSDERISTEEEESSFRAALSKRGLQGRDIDEYVTAAKSKDAGITSVLASLQAQEEGLLASGKGATSPGESGFGTEASSAQQRYSLTVATHQQILQAMSALAARLGVR